MAKGKLKPCPFCGCTHLEYTYHGGGCRVRCSNCMTRGPFADETTEATRKWNRRQEAHDGKE